jgi:translation elongation factor EF-Ts
MTISAQDVKNLREETGAGMMDCKKPWKKPAVQLKKQSRSFVKRESQKLRKKLTERLTREQSNHTFIWEAGLAFSYR